MKIKIHLKMQTLLLLVLIPSLTIITAVMAWINYNDLYNIILRGFDQKLLAVSTVTGSYVRGDDHREITKMVQIRGLAFDPLTGTLYGSSFSSDILLQVNVSTGWARKTAITGAGSLQDIAYVPEERMLYGIESEKKRMIKIDPATGKTSVAYKTGSMLYGLAYDINSGVFYANDANLVRIDRKTGRTDIIGPIGFEAVRGLAFDPADKILYGIDTRTNQLIKVNTKSGSAALISKLKYGSASPDSSQTPLQFGCFGLAFNNNKKLLYGSTTTSLAGINPGTGSVEPSGFFIPGNEKREKLYIHYADPMIKIREKCNFTYLFTFTLADKAKRLCYTLDSTQDESHSYVGYRDPDEAQDEIRDVWFKGNPYSSEISYWEEWGLLKSAYTAILDNEENIAGISGADVNISIIQEKTRKALIKVIIIGILSLIIGIIVSFFISRRLIRPIEKFKEVALKVAAGMFGREVEISEIKEFEDLSKSFNSMSKSLEQTLKEIKKHNESIENSRRTREIIKILLGTIERQPYPKQDLFFQKKLTDRFNCNDSSGYLYTEGKILMWLAEAKDNPFESIMMRHNICIALTKLMEKHGGSLEKAWNEIGELFCDNVDSYILLSPEEGRAEFLVNRPFRILLADSNDNFKIIEIKGAKESLDMENHEALVISTDNKFEELIKSEELKGLTGDRMAGAEKFLSSLEKIFKANIQDAAKMLAVMVKI